MNELRPRNWNDKNQRIILLGRSLENKLFKLAHIFGRNRIIICLYLVIKKKTKTVNTDFFY